MERIIGIAAAPGLASGKLHLVGEVELTIPEHKSTDPEAEISRLVAARAKAAKDLAALKEQVLKGKAASEAEIFEAHLMILEDESILSEAETAIRAGENAEKAWMDASEMIAGMLEQLDDATLSARAADIRDVGRRVLAALLGVETGGLELQEPVVIAGRDLTPSDTASVDQTKALAFVTAEGGPTSHTAILAKAYGIPAIVGLGEKLLHLPQGTLMLVDGSSGEVVVDPDQASLDAFKLRFAQAQDAKGKALSEAMGPAITLDGVQVEVVANIGGAADARRAIENGAEGVGLFRTEFLYLDRDNKPTLEEQTQAYRETFEIMRGKPVVVRTLDIGGDKFIPYLNFPTELNPFLGWRGVRMLNGQEDLTVDQIKALLTASGDTDLRVMVPMISGLAEVRAMQALIKRVRAELEAQGVQVTGKFQFGTMVEVPSAAILADRMALELDFFSIGTNDLTQYTLAVDRTNSQVAHLGNALDPAVLYLIQRTIDAAHNAGKWCGMCGELAGEPLAWAILLGMGLDEFSMAPARIPSAKQVLRQLDSADCKELAMDALKAGTAAEVEALAKAYYASKGISV